MKRYFCCVIILVLPWVVLGQDDVSGFWKTVNETHGVTTSVIAIYEFEGKLYGQVIVGYDEQSGTLIDTIYDPVQHIAYKTGNPYLCKSTLFWNLEHKEDKYIKGTIVDPRSGWRFSCQLWKRDENLVVRGNIGFIGKNQIFYPADESDFPVGFILPDLGEFIPCIPD